MKIRQCAGRCVAIGGNRWIARVTATKVARVTAQLIRARCTIMTGGAEGVDHAVLRACLLSRARPRLQVFLPFTIEKQYEHYRALEGEKKARTLRDTLLKVRVRFPGAVRENRRPFVSYRKACDARNRSIENRAECSITFKPQGSTGSREAIKRAKERGIPYWIFV